MVHRLHLLSHGPTAAQRQGRFPADEGIESLPPEDVRALRETLDPLGAYFSGPERRNRETAEALGVDAEPRAELAAWSSSRWAGLPISAVAQDDAEAFAAWRTDPASEGHGGESLNTFLARVAAWLDSQATVAGSSLVVADASVIRAALVHALEARPPTFWRLDVPPLSLSTIQSAGAGSRVRTLNAAG